MLQAQQEKAKRRGVEMEKATCGRLAAGDGDRASGPTVKTRHLGHAKEQRQLGRPVNRSIRIITEFQIGFGYHYKRPSNVLFLP